MVTGPGPQVLRVEKGIELRSSQSLSDCYIMYTFKPTTMWALSIAYETLQYYVLHCLVW